MNRATRDHPHGRWTIANGLTAFRLFIAAPALVILAVIGSHEGFLWMLMASFASDFLDGTVARLTGGTTQFGARLDSWADGAAYCAIAVGISVLWPQLVAQEWPAFVVILASFVVPGLFGLIKFGHFSSYHTVLVKLAVGATAAALLIILWGGPGWPLRVAALLALAAALEELAISWVLKTPRSNIASIFKVRREQRRARDSFPSWAWVDGARDGYHRDTVSHQEATAMFKVMVMIKRKPGMSMADFINYYETNHAPLGASKVPNLKRYVRHFIRPYGNEVYSADAEPTYDVLTEIWFDDEADFKQGMAYLTEPETAAIIGADEEKLFDKSSIRFMIMEDHETKLPV